MPAISASRPGTSRPGSSRALGTLGGRVRWDRLGRVAMLCVLVALLYLYASAGVHMLSTWRQSRHDSAAVAAMEREHIALVHQREALTGAGTLETEARQLGMMKSGEQPYVISGLPDD
ncbi:MAG: FtsB family cell division protein [Solirubrobacteraceae bacterium]